MPPSRLIVRYRRTFQHGQYQNQDVDLTYEYDLGPEEDPKAELRQTYKDLQVIGEELMIDALSRSAQKPSGPPPGFPPSRPQFRPVPGGKK